ncbi:MAG TPA: RagB/SusD family nutrient uptake outer membrane protein [Pseudobacter sp.]|nr:RagB/SusD family nutrient uptake outer membrane protein [Pseudobacter sp.]
MKTIYKSILYSWLFISFTGCSKYLEEKSQDEVRPASVAELQQLMMGEVYPAGSIKSSFHAYLDLMTDDMVSNFKTSTMGPTIYRQYEGPYTWRAEMFEMMESALTPDAIDTYAHYYKRIKGCNVVLDMIDQVKGDENERENVRGQALAMRSYYYFMLMNLFAQPYNTPGIDRESAPGVELILDAVVKDEYPKRASMQRVYDQISADLLKALPLIREHASGNSKFRVTTGFVYTLLSRLSLYQEKWEEAAEYAKQGLAINSALLRLASVPYPAVWKDPATNVYSINSPEAIWLGYGSGSEYSNMARFDYDILFFTISPELRSKYDFTRTNTNNRGDLRMRYYYYWDYSDYDWTIYVPMIGKKLGGTTSSNVVKGMRVAELYLNRAEANIMLYLKNGDEALRSSALSDLNFLRSNRYDTRNVAYTPVDFSGQALLDFYRDERRRELSFEDHRWFDLRRYGMPEIRHKFQSSANQAPVEYVLQKNDKRYTLPIPRSALIKNPSLEPNP